MSEKNTHEYAQYLAEKADELMDSGNGHKQEAGANLMHLAELAGLSDGKDEEIPQNKAVNAPVGQMMSDIEEEEIDWLWQDRFPLCTTSLVCGMSGVGKSTWMSDIIARVTTHGRMPDGSEGVKGGVVLINIEDPIASVQLPRLRLAGADLSKVSNLSIVRRRAARIGETVESPFTIPDDLALLDQEIRRVKAVLVVIDPILAVINSSISAYRGQSVTALILPMMALCEHRGCATVLVGHFTKSGSKDPIERIGGSKEWVNRIRSVLVLTQDGGKPSRSIVSVVKHNLCPEPPQVLFERGEKGEIVYVGGEITSYAESQKARRLSEARLSIMRLLETEPIEPHNVSEVAQTLDIDYRLVRKHLSNMAQEGKIRAIGARGMYSAWVQKTEVSPVSPVSLPSLPSLTEAVF